MKHSESANRQIRNRQSPVILALAAIFLLASIALAQGGYDLSWWTVDGGGGSSSGGSYVLDGTAGQADVGSTMSGDSYQLVGGFWGGAPSGVSIFEVYLPVIVRQW